MSTTHSYIGIQNSDGTIQAVYCHNFGYPEGLGVTLQTHYNSLAAALEIMKLGDLSFLGKKLNPPSNQVHSWENPSQDISIAYGRDRGEVGTEVKHFGNLDKLMFFCASTLANCVYLFRDGAWYYSEVQSQNVWEPCTSIEEVLI
jgi:hypothetical protein